MMRPYQLRAVEAFLKQKAKRLLLALPTGAGKTRTAIECARALGAKRILIVASAMARPVWIKEFQKWAPELAAERIRFGRERKRLTKAQTAERISAYEADVQVVSYALLGNLDSSARDLLIIDEAHALRAPTSKQSRTVRAFLNANPTVPVLALTATPVPNEISGVWNLADLLSPGILGKRAEDGGISWAFKRNYMIRIVSEYGIAFKGAQEDALPRLRSKLEPITFEVLASETNTYMPPVTAAMLYIDEPRKDAEVAEDWLEQELEGSATHLALIPFSHALHANLETMALKHGIPVFAFTGSTTVEVRQEMLDQARASERAIVIATAGCVSESVSLSMCTRALFLEWRATPLQAIQLLGRFPRPDAKPDAKFSIQYVCHAKDEGKIEELADKITSAAALFGVGSSGEVVSGTMKARVMSDEARDAMMLDLFSDFNESAAERVNAELLGKETDDD